jgi:hypothetical protein
MLDVLEVLHVSTQETTSGSMLIICLSIWRLCMFAFSEISVRSVSVILDVLLSLFMFVLSECSRCSPLVVSIDSEANILALSELSSGSVLVMFCRCRVVVCLHLVQFRLVQFYLCFSNWRLCLLALTEIRYSILLPRARGAPQQPPNNLNILLRV